MTDHHPNALAWRRPPKSDPWPDPEPIRPLVTRLRSDTLEERRMVDELERYTAKALDAWLRLGRLP